jgi:hypothetical protein
MPRLTIHQHIKAAKEAMEMVARGIVPGTLNFFVDTLPFRKQPHLSRKQVLTACQ